MELGLSSLELMSKMETTHPEFAILLGPVPVPPSGDCHQARGTVRLNLGYGARPVPVFAIWTGERTAG